MNRTDAHVQLLAAVRSAADEAEGQALAGDPQGVVALVNLGMELADAGLVFASRPVLEALDRAQTAGVVAPDEATWIFNLRGLEAFALGEAAKAVGLYRRALDSAQAGKDSAATTNALLNLGIVSWQLGDLASSLDYFHRGLAAAGARDKSTRTKVEVNLVGLYFDMGEDAQARQVLARLHRSRQFREEPRLRAAVYGLRGLEAARNQDLLGAERLFLHSIHEAREAGAYDHELAGLQNLAAVRLDLGRIGGALRRLRQAVRLAAAIESYRVLDPVQRTLATALYRAGRPSDAKRVLTAAAAAADARGDIAAKSKAWTDLGSLLLLGGRAREALAVLEPSHEAHLQALDREWAVKSLTALSRALIETGRPDEAEARFVSGLDRIDIAGVERTALLEALADLLLGSSAVEAAKAVYRTVAAGLTSADTAGDRLASIGDKLAAVDPAEAVRFYTRALEQEPTSLREINVDQVLNDRALANAGTGNLKAAAQDLTKALIAAKSRNDRVMQAIVLTNASEVARRDGRLAEARKLATDSIAVSLRTGPGPRADAFAARALAELELDRPSNAKQDARRAIDLAHLAGDRSAEAIGLGVLAALEFGADRPDRAVTHWEAAAAIEAAEKDSVHEIESVAGLIEAAALMKEAEATEAYLQRLIDLVQRHGAPLAVAQTAIARACVEWLAVDSGETAAELFAVLVLLTAAETVGEDPNEFVTAIARQAFVVFHLARDQGQVVSDRLERATSKRLKRRFHSSAGPLLEIMSAMRLAAAKGSSS